MTVRVDTLALALPAPYLLQREASNTLTAPLRYGAAGAVVAPSSGTITITRPDGTALASAASVTISSSIATYTLTPSAAEVLGSGWTVVWELTVDGAAYTLRQSAYLCKYVPPNVIAATDLYVRMPELALRVPPAQSDRAGGSGVGWQPQIDAAYYELIQRLISDGQRPWQIREVTGYREWLLCRALQLAVGTIPSSGDDAWRQARTDAYHAFTRADGQLRLQYDTDSPGFRRTAGPVVTLAPAGRPLW